jgi:phage terminase large subunit-like protein
VVSIATVDQHINKLAYHQLRKFLSLGEIRDLIYLLPDNEAYRLRYDYEFWARPGQRLPEGNWRVWFLNGGRGSGKTWTGSQVIKKWSHTNELMLLIGRTAYDVRDTMIEGDSGILATAPKQWRPEYQPSKRKLVWPNGASALLRSADEPDSFRGIHFYKAWGDELASWRYGKETWDNVMFGLRLGKNPQMIVTTTPRPTKLVKEIIAMNTTHVNTETTYANLENLAEAWAADVISKYRDTRTGLQELLGRILDDNPNALWTRKMIDDTRVYETDDLDEICVAVDPAVADTEAETLRNLGKVKERNDTADTGIVVVGRIGTKGDRESEGYTLDDMTIHGSPHDWAMEVASAFFKYRADSVVAEANNGGALVKANIQAINPNIPVELVYAARGKVTRAEPVSNIYSQRRAHHVGMFGPLEDQLCEWEPGMKSPDRLDALVWGYTHLMVDPTVQRLHVLGD